MSSEGSKSSTHYLNYKNRFDVSSKGPSSGISVGGRGKHACFYTSEYIKQHVTKRLMGYWRKWKMFQRHFSKYENSS